MVLSVDANFEKDQTNDAENLIIYEMIIPNPSKTSQYIHSTTYHPPGVKRGFIKGEATKIAQNKLFENNI